MRRNADRAWLMAVVTQRLAIAGDLQRFTFRVVPDHAYRGLDALVYLAAPPPVYPPGGYDIPPDVVTNEVVPLIRQVATSAGAPLIDVFKALSGKASNFPDTVHPGAAGAQIITDTVAAALQSGGFGGARGTVTGGTSGAGGTTRATGGAMGSGGVSGSGGRGGTIGTSDAGGGLWSSGGASAGAGGSSMSGGAVCGVLGAPPASVGCGVVFLLALLALLRWRVRAG